MKPARQSPLIVVAEALSDAAIHRLQTIGRVLLPDPAQPHAWKNHLDRAVALIVRTYAQVTADVIAQAPQLRVIGRAGVGLENIDLHAARERGIQVVFTPAASTRAVAELTIGLIVALQRNLVAGDRAVRGGGFIEARGGDCGPELGGQMLGIIGMGRIGRAVGRICARGLGMKVQFNDIIPIRDLDFSAEAVEKRKLYRTSDIVSLHVPLTELTRDLIDETALAEFRRGACLINTARGRVVNSTALAAALESKLVGGAALDALDVEPPPSDHPLLSAPNCLLSPHIGSRTEESLAAMNGVVEDVIAVLEGRAPVHPAPDPEMR